MSGLSWEIGASALVHVVMFAGAMLMRWEDDAKPPVRPQEVIMVDLPGPAKSKTAIPQKAERTVDAVKGTAPTPPDPAPPAPAPPKQSDLSFETPKAPPTPSKSAATAQAAPKEDAKAAKLREEMLADMRRRQLLQDMEAPVGKEDRAKASPNGTMSPDQAGSGKSANPSELAKWGAEARRRVNPNWHPITAICQQNPSLTAVIRVSVDGSGMQKEPPRVMESSGNVSADSWAMEAVEATKQLPATPGTHPEGWVVGLKFSCKEAL